MPRHRVTAAALIVPLVLSAGCTSGSKHAASTRSSTSTAASAGALALETSLHTALTKLTSAAITIDAGGLIATTTGHIALTDGAATASDITIGTGSDATRVITVGSTAYAKLPAGQDTSGKPYVKVSAASTNEFVRGLAGNLEILQATYSLGDLADLLTTATGFTDKGSAPLGGVTTHLYSFSVTGDANGSDLQKQLAEIASTPVPVELYVNAQNLPVQVVLDVKLGGASLPITATLGSFDAPFTVAAPPANEVAAN